MEIDGETELDAMEKENFRLLKQFSKKLGVQLGKTKTRSIQDSSIAMLQILHELSYQMVSNGIISERHIIVNTKPNQILFRTFPSGSEVLSGNVTFCNPTVLSNAQISNVKINDTIAKLTIKKRLRLFNFIPISMLFGAQLKAGKNERGLFADCCEYAVIEQFCNDNFYDGIVQIDQADTFRFNSNETLPEVLHTDYIDPSARELMNSIVLDNIIKNEAFPSIEGNALDGGIYPEIMLCGIKSLGIEVESLYPFPIAYSNEKLLRICTLPGLIPNDIPGTELVRVIDRGNKRVDINPELVQRHLRLNVDNETLISGLPYLSSRKTCIQYSNKVIKHLRRLLYHMISHKNKQSEPSERLSTILGPSEWRPEERAEARPVTEARPGAAEMLPGGGKLKKKTRMIKKRYRKTVKNET